MKSYKITYSDGTSYVTSMNATLEEARKYFIGNIVVVKECEETGKEIKKTISSVDPLPSEITVVGRRWFRKSVGGTYHTAEIIIDGEKMGKTPITRGYGQEYEESALVFLEQGGFIPKRDRFSGHFRMIMEDLGIKATSWFMDVSRKSDL